MRATVAAMAGLLCALVLAPAGSAHAQEPRRPRPTAPRPGDGGPGGSAPVPGMASRVEGDRTAPVTVDADRLEAFQKEGLVVFTGNVVARQSTSVQYADRMDVYLDPAGDRIARTVSTGNVRIVTTDCRMGTARRAEYYDAEQRVLLIGDARVWQEDNVVTGERITIYLAEDRSLVEGGRQERVRAVFHPRSEAGGRPDGASAGGRAPGATCP